MAYLSALPEVESRGRPKRIFNISKGVSAVLIFGKALRMAFTRFVEKEPTNKLEY
jgi:hypothetical protein